MENTFKNIELSRKFYLFKFVLSCFLTLCILSLIDVVFFDFLRNPTNTYVVIALAISDSAMLFKFNSLSPSTREVVVDIGSLITGFFYMTDLYFRLTFLLENANMKDFPKEIIIVCFLEGICIALVLVSASISKYQKFLVLYVFLIILYLAYLIQHAVGGIIGFVALMQFVILNENEKMVKRSQVLMLNSGKEAQTYRSLILNFMPIPMVLVSESKQFTPNQKFISEFADTEFNVLADFVIIHETSVTVKTRQPKKDSSNTLEAYVNDICQNISLWKAEESKQAKVAFVYGNAKSYYTVYFQKLIQYDQNDAVVLIFEKNDSVLTPCQERKIYSALGQAAHDLKAPSNHIEMIAKTIKEKEKAQKIGRLCKYQGFVISSIIEYVKGIHGKASIETPQIIDVQEIASECMDIFADVAMEKGVELEVLLNGQNILEFSPIRSSGRTKTLMRTRPGTLKRVFINFLSNSMKFTNKGKISIRIKCCGSNKAEFEVVDTGVGMTEEVKKKLFQSFETHGSGEIKNSEGTGLGLTICKELIEKSLKGRIFPVESEVNKGTTFRFSIESNDESPGKDKSDRKSFRSSSISSSEIMLSFKHLPDEGIFDPAKFYPKISTTKFANATRLANKYKITVDDFAKVTVAIIDDDLFVIRHLKAMFQILQVNVTYVYLDGVAAVDQLTSLTSKQFPSLLISDMFLPSMNGLQVAKKIREQSQTGAKPYIVLNSSETEMVEKTPEINEIIKKPTRLESLLDVVLLAALRARLQDESAQ